MSRNKVRRLGSAFWMALILSLPTAARAADSAARASAETTFHALHSSAKSARAQWRPGQPGPTVVTGLRTATEGSTPAARAADFLRRHEALIGVAVEDFSLEEVTPSRYGASVRLQQRFEKLPVQGREVIVTLDPDGYVTSMTSSAAPVTQLLEARIDEARAYELARKALPGLVVTPEQTAVVLPALEGGAPGRSFLASRPEELRAFRVFVNLHQGTVAGVQEITKR